MSMVSSTSDLSNIFMEIKLYTWVILKKSPKLITENVEMKSQLLINCLRKNFYQKDGRHYQSFMNGHVWSQTILVLVTYSGQNIL